MAISHRTLGRTGVEVSVFGLGGEGVLRTFGRDKEAVRLIRRALDLGVTYFESARAYAGSEGYLGQALGPDRDRVFLATKSHHRRARSARAHLEESLAALRTDWLDLWMLHDLRTRADLDTVFGPGGALETFVKAQEAGEVRFLGISGHQDPEILCLALDTHPFDCVLMPVNPCEAATASFAATALPVAAERGVGVIAMKTLCRGLLGRFSTWEGSAPYLRYALSAPGVSLASVGCDDTGQLDENVAAVSPLKEMSPQECETEEQRVRPFARRVLYYRS